MGLPDGWVTKFDLPYQAQLHILGNGVVPQQAARALFLLIDECGGFRSERSEPVTRTVDDG
jgi:hypothetical protein